MDKLNNIVEQCIKQHTGGEEFFTALDKQVQDDEIITKLHLLVYATLRMRDYDGIIVSGKFGKFYQENYSLSGFAPSAVIVCVEGGLRATDATIDLSQQAMLLSMRASQRWIFFDDSFYSGTTRDVVKKTLESIGHELVHSFVVYDGSKDNDETVSSLFKYYSK